MTAPAPELRSQVKIAEWLITSLAELLNIDSAEIDPNQPVTSLGIDSMQYIGLIGDLEESLGCRFTDNPLIDYPTINGLSEFVAQQLAQGRTTIDPVPKQS